MYDIKQPLLVLATPTYHPVLEHHTGYIFQLYEIYYSKPRELFFQHIFEAQVYALHVGAEFSIDMHTAPGVVTALDYVLNANPYDNWPEAPADGNKQADTVSTIKEWEKEPGVVVHSLTAMTPGEGLE